MNTAVMIKSEEHDGVDNDTTEDKQIEDTTTMTVNYTVTNDKGIILNDISLEAEVVSFINEYRNKEIADIEQPAVILSKLRSLYNDYSAKMERSGSITKGILTKYGIQRGMLLNIEKKFLEHSGRQWLEHYTREYGEKSLRTAQDYMKLGNTPNILQYAVIGKERLMKILRAIKNLGIESDDPIATLFQQCGISFDLENFHIEEKMTELKIAVDNTIAESRIKKAEEEKGIVLDVNLDHINNLIKNGVSVTGRFINDLFELKSEGKDVNNHLESLCSEDDDEDGDDLLPHIKKVSLFPKIVDRLKTTVESLNQNSGLVKRIEQSQIDDLERYVTELKNLYLNQNTHE